MRCKNHCRPIANWASTETKLAVNVTIIKAIGGGGGGGGVGISKVKTTTS